MHAFDDDFDTDDTDLPDGDEAQVWQLLQLLNPGDEAAALAQFDDYREAVAALDGEAFEPVAVVARVIDWRAGFRLAPDDTRALVEVLDELCARWNVAIDWDGDPSDDEFHEQTDAAALLAIAHDRLAEAGYTLWMWDSGTDDCAGWITASGDAEPMRELAAVMGIDLHLGSDAG